MRIGTGVCDTNNKAREEGGDPRHHERLNDHVREIALHHVHHAGGALVRISHHSVEGIGIFLKIRRRKARLEMR